MSLILDTQEGTKKHGESILPAANECLNSTCSICQSGTVSGIFIEPLCFNDVERAIALKKNEIPQGTNKNRYHSQPKQQSRKHARDEDIEIEAESPYLLLSNGKSSISCSGPSRGQQRTGRWTHEESALVDFLVTTFDQGLLPLPHGIKLNEFLGDVLLCKSSRLTKKMKNAKLSTRTFVLGKPSTQFSTREREQLSMLQKSFLSSLSSESTRLTLQLNLTKQWRTHFYNVCLQIGYPHVQDKAWNASLQELEKRASRAEEVVRRLRRRKMGLSSPFDNPMRTFVNPNPVFDLIKVDQSKSQPTTTDIDINPSISRASIVSNEHKLRTISSGSGEEEALNINYDDGRFPPSRQRALSTDISISSIGYNKGRDRSFSEDFEKMLDVLITDEATDDHNISTAKTPTSEKKTCIPSAPASNFCKSLLDAFVTYIEKRNMPFQHLDLWVPSFSTGDLSGLSKSVDVDQLHLHHAGHTCRRDVSNDLAHMLHEFGVYSSYFSFEPGKGLPGRVYSTGVASWECAVHRKNSNDFGRVEGAELYGIKTALAIPLNTAMVGRIVVLIYSCENVPEDVSLSREIASELTKYSLEPKWKLVLDSGASSSTPTTTRSSQQLMVSIPEHETKKFSSFTDENILGTNGTTVNSVKYEPKVLRNVPTTIKSSQIPMVCIDHSAKGSSQSAHDGIQTTNYEQTASKASHNPTKVVFCDVEECTEDHELATFLLKNMPAARDSVAEGLISSSNDEKTLRPYFFSFRLLLLRPSSERTSRENEIIQILKKSFSSYLRDNCREGIELAKLLVKDWVCLKSTYSFQEITTQHNEPSKPEGGLLPVTPTLPMHTESMPMKLYKPIPPQQNAERGLSSDFHGSNSKPTDTVFEG
eukprot:CAMPEP_0168240442 /NCGR_PEP_ID=MMETSP0140_2-20121125/22185_1 /TAXON_ID=44445 /ORGANISM="Pseudo-nitzschia australis, Strain 10249 10 AB" /LENGTH=872 /DNA_ID=CAMNT_0008175069 /DNA_START=362 /DNA_END=2981 /DNA_ORIENTATION=+